MNEYLSQWRRDKSGYVTIEAVLAMSFFVIVLFLSIGFFTYIYPQTTLQREIHTLATIAERQGGLTQTDIEQFKEKLNQYDFIRYAPSEIEVTAVTSESGIDASNVSPLGSSGTQYITRGSNEIINITVKVPANDGLIRPIAEFFNVTDLSDHYVLSESVMSERY